MNDFSVWLSGPAAAWGNHCLQKIALALHVGHFSASRLQVQRQAHAHTAGGMALCCRLSKPVGQQLAELPVDARLGAALLASGRLGCSEEAATVVAMLNVHSVWAGARGERKALEAAKAKCAPILIPFKIRLKGCLKP